MPKEYRLHLLNRVYILPEGDVRLGRDPSCHVYLEGDMVSRFHALIRVSDGGSFISDLDSENGTFLNHQRISEPQPLAHGDRVRVAFFDIVYEEHKKSANPARTVMLVFCTDCGAVLSPDMRFCTQCGVAVRFTSDPLDCASCGAVLTRDMRFCFRCGQKVSEG